MAMCAAKGLMLGIEIVKDRATKEPAKAECAQVLESAREMGLLIGKGGLARADGPVRPADVHQSRADADFLLEVLDRAFAGL